MQDRKPFNYRGCRIVPECLSQPILIACNCSVNRYLRLFWRIEFPDQTWIRVGTKGMARQYIHLHGAKHGAA